MGGVFGIDIFAAMLRMSTPILLAAIGCLLTAVVGMLNVALEGMMLISAFTALAVGHFTSNVWVGLVAAVAAGVGMAWVLAVFTFKFKADVIIVGSAINILGDGLTIFLMSMLFGGARGSFSSDRIAGLPTLHLPWIDRVPILGQILSGHSPLVYVALVSVGVVHIVMYRTTLGLRMRAVGENPAAAQAAGIDVMRMRFVAVLASGVLAGLAGSQLSIGFLTMFARNMTAGRGFIALAANVFGGSTPIGVLGASLLFGFADAFQMRLQQLGYPVQFILMIPYLLAIAVLSVAAARALPRTSRKLNAIIATKEAKDGVEA